MLCGIGFTMSIFIASLAFEGLDNFSTYARLGILIGSTLAAILGLLLLNCALPKNQLALKLLIRQDKVNFKLYSREIISVLCSCYNIFICSTSILFR